MKQIPLTQGKFALVDDEDFEYLNQFNWCAVKFANYYYAQRSPPRARKKRRSIYMHREILGIIDPKIMVDHKDRDGCNNLRDNLRIATKAQNAFNVRSHKDSTSKYLGVSWYKTYNKWNVRIQNGGKNKNIGYFESEESAALAYNKAALQFHGEFANLNNVEETTNIHGGRD